MERGSQSLDLIPLTPHCKVAANRDELGRVYEVELQSAGLAHHPNACMGQRLHLKGLFPRKSDFEMPWMLQGVREGS